MLILFVSVDYICMVYAYIRPEEGVGCLSLPSLPCSLRQGLLVGLETVPCVLGYAVVKSTCGTHTTSTWLLKSELPALCLHNQTEPSLQRHKTHFKSYLRLGRN